MPDIALTNVRVFDGHRLLEPGTVVISGGHIGTETAGADVVDCEGGVLLPGLIDAHVHLHGPESLDQLASHGVTTALDMACWPPALVDSLRNARGTTDIRSAGTPAVAPGSKHSKLPGFPATAVVAEPDGAKTFVADRVAEGSDYIKVVAEPPGPDAFDPATLEALISAARDHGKLSIAHAAAFGAVVSTAKAGADVLTHVPLDRPIDDVAAALLKGRTVVPTLTMMAGVAANVPQLAYRPAELSVTALHRAGVLILAGTDANATPGAPANVPHGSSMHEELERLVDAGLSTVEALRAATSAPAQVFGLADRGAIAPGLRADLVLLDGDPIADIRATRRIRRIWCEGIEHAPA
ncbi:amidohydrolase family protein [Lentzea sp. E54]|uniref:amidohydrolase family protein n=1 Tax=Lentzea xerophila TaxID=3435883 RepID=UPI003DA4E479